MSDPANKFGPKSKSAVDAQQDEERTPQGPNLLIAYGLMALALLIAITFAALIVWPFYKAR